MTPENAVIFWDYEQCHVPPHATGYDIAQKIRSIAMGYGSVRLFKAYLDTTAPTKSPTLRAELQSSGVTLADCPHNGHGQTVEKTMLVDILTYAIDNSAPSTIILVTGDRDFAYAVSTLRLRRYNVVLISHNCIYASLKTQASLFHSWATDILDIQGAGDSCVSCHHQIVGSALPAQNPRDSGTEAARAVSKSSPTLGKNGIPSFTGADSFKSSHDHRANNAHASALQGPPLPNKQGNNRPLPKFAAFGETSSLSTQRTGTVPNGSGLGLFGKPSIEPKDSTTPPSPTISGQGSVYQIPPKRTTLSSSDHLALTIGSIPEAIPTPEPDSVASRRPTAPPVPLPKPAHEAPSSNVPVGPVAPVLDTEPTVPTVILPTFRAFPPMFKTIIERLQYHRSKGSERPRRSTFAAELTFSEPDVYKNAGVKKWSQYAILAEKEGIVELGGLDGNAWIALAPEWCNAMAIE